MDLLGNSAASVGTFRFLGLSYLDRSREPSRRTRSAAMPCHTKELLLSCGEYIVQRRCEMGGDLSSHIDGL
jgi:hypothetical protein